MSRPKLVSIDEAPSRQAMTRPSDVMPNARNLPLELLVENQYFTRSQSDDVTELARDVAENGILQPLIVRPMGDGKYEVVAGNRRRAAAIEAKLSEVPCIIEDMNDQQAALATARENFQRIDLTITEEAQMYQTLIDTLGIEGHGADTDLAKVLNRNRLRIYRVRRVAEDKDLLAQVSNNTLTLTAALDMLAEREGTKKPKSVHREQIEPEPIKPEPIPQPRIQAMVDRIEGAPASALFGPSATPYPTVVPPEGIEEQTIDVVGHKRRIAPKVEPTPASVPEFTRSWVTESVSVEYDDSGALVRVVLLPGTYTFKERSEITGDNLKALINGKQYGGQAND